MIVFAEATAALKARGYTDANVEAKLAQDVLLDALSRSGFRENVTVKGGVVMANLTGDIRRTTLDIDVDFVRYGIDDESIRAFVRDLDSPDGVSVSIVGDIVELRQQDYKGKRVFLELRDGTGATLQTKLDIGVHVHSEARQRETGFDVSSVAAEPALLLANAPEQVFAEKLKSLLRLGPVSNRGKDVFDMVYLADRVDRSRLLALIGSFVFDDPRMLENDLDGILRRIRLTFADRNYAARLSNRRSNWLQIDSSAAMERLFAFLQSLRS